MVLYTGSSAGATAEGQAQLRAFFDAFPPGPVCGTPKGVIGPVIARFDQMSTPFQAIVWGRVLTLDSFDQAKILAFWQQWGEKTNPEPQCAAPSPSGSDAAERIPGGERQRGAQRDADRNAGPELQRRSVTELIEDRRCVSFRTSDPMTMAARASWSATG